MRTWTSVQKPHVGMLEMISYEKPAQKYNDRTGGVCNRSRRTIGNPPRDVSYPKMRILWSI